MSELKGGIFKPMRNHQANFEKHDPKTASTQAKVHAAESIDELTAMLGASEQQKAELTAKLEASEKQKAELSAKLEAAEKANQTIQQSLERVQSENLKLEKEKATLTKIVQRQSAPNKELLNSELKKDDKEEIEKLNAKIAELTSSKEKDIDEAKKTRENEVKERDKQITDLKAELAKAKESTSASTPPTGTSDMTKQIADLKAELDKAKAASAIASPLQAKIEAILKNFKTNQPYDDGTYIISKLSEGYHIKLKAVLTPETPKDTPKDTTKEPSKI